MQFELLPPKELPYYQLGRKLSDIVKESSNRRGMNRFSFALRKIKIIVLHRLAYFCPINSWRIKMHRWRGVHIGKNVYLGMHCVIDNAYPEYVYIEDYASLTGEVSVLAHTNVSELFAPLFSSSVQPTVISYGCAIGIKSVILPGVVVGEYAFVSAGTVVDKSVPPYTLVHGSPMKKALNFERLLKHKDNVQE